MTNCSQEKKPIVILAKGHMCEQGRVSCSDCGNAIKPGCVCDRCIFSININMPTINEAFSTNYMGYFCPKCHSEKTTYVVTRTGFHDPYGSGTEDDGAGTIICLNPECNYKRSGEYAELQPYLIRNKVFELRISEILIETVDSNEEADRWKTEIIREAIPKLKIQIKQHKEKVAALKGSLNIEAGNLAITQAEATLQEFQQFVKCLQTS